MRLTKNNPAKQFQANDVMGNPVTLEKYRGRRLLLSFLRFAGCPICNLHIHQWLERKEQLEESNLEILIILESDSATIRKYIENEKLPFTFVSDPQNILYDSYAVETSWLRYLRMYFSIDIWLRAVRGWSLYSAWAPIKGTMNRVEAEFLIDEQGKIVLAHYGAKIGDYIPLEYYLD